jgi:hypothetical protein
MHRPRPDQYRLQGPPALPHYHVPNVPVLEMEGNTLTKRIPEHYDTVLRFSNRVNCCPLSQTCPCSEKQLEENGRVSVEDGLSRSRPNLD